MAQRDNPLARRRGAQQAAPGSAITPGDTSLAFQYGIQLGDQLRIKYGELLRPRIQRYLRLYRLLEDNTPEEVILMHVHDAIKNAINHFSESSEACYNAERQIMEQELALGVWHLDLARLLTLLPFLDLLKKSVRLVQGWLMVEGKPAGYTAFSRRISRLIASHKTASGKARLLANKRNSSARPRPPTPRQTAQLIAVVEELADIVDDYQEILRDLKDEYEIPQLIEIRRQLAAAPTK